jgi:hypothetical protein
MAQFMQDSRNATISLTGGTPQKISEAKAFDKRIVIIITNLNSAGGDNIFISVANEAKANTGIQLLPGQSVTFSRDSGYTPSQEAFYAYCANNASLAVYEEILRVV